MSNIKRIPNNDPIVNRIENLIRSQHILKKDLLSYLGLNESSYTKWRYTQSKSYMKYIPEIAEYLGVTAEYLISGNTDKKEDYFLSEDEKYIIKKYRIFDKETKQAFLKIIEKMNR